MFFSNKKLSAVLILTITFLGIIIPLHFSHAWMMGLDAAITWVIQTLTKLYFGIYVSQFALQMANGILGWVTNPSFIQGVGGYTHNVLVLEGWRITRDLANMFFILIMVGIGIATMLRIKGYEIKKLLPKALAIVILINFTPLICGIIIDASNILTNFFLSGGTRGVGTIINNTQAPQNSLGGLLHSFWETAKSFDFTGMALAIFQAIISLSFNILATFILLLLAMLFLMRYLMLWMLVILSPLAFFAFILPATKKIWNMWWEEFIEWCFIGVGAAFFLYLTERMIDISDSLFLAPSGSETQLGNSGLAQMLVYSIPLLFLAAGYMATTMFAPTGAKQIIGLAKRGAKWPMTKQGKATREKFRNWGQSKLRQTGGPKVERIINRLNSYKPNWGQNPNEGTIAGRWTKRQGAEMVGLVTKIATIPSKAIFGEGSGPDRKITNESYKKAKDKDMWANVAKLKSSSKAEKLGILKAMAELGQIKEAMKEKQISPSTLIEGFGQAVALNDKKTMKELTLVSIHDEALMKNFARVIQKVKGTKNEPMTNGLSEKDRKQGLQSYQDKVLARLRKESDFEKLQMTDKLKERLGKVATNFYDANQLGQAGKTLGRDFMDTVQNNAQDKGASWFFEIDENTGKARNPRLPRFFNSSAANNMGYGPIEGAENTEKVRGLQVESNHWENALSSSNSPEEINNLIKEINEAEKQSANKEIKRIIHSAMLAAEKKLQETPGSIETEYGKINIEKKATEDIKREQRRREPGPDERGETTGGSNKTREPGPDER